MNKTVLMLALISFMSLGLVASNSNAARTTGRSKLMVFNSHDLVGAPVKDSHGELMGIVQEVIVDSEGQAFAVVNHGDYDLSGVSGINTPVPFRELQISQTKGGQDTAVLKTDMEHLDFAPYLDPTKRFDRQFETNVYDNTGSNPIGPKAVDYRSNKI
jgi:hypothetical protein